MTNEEVLLKVQRGIYPIPLRGEPPHCSNCGCSKEMHNQLPHSWPGNKGCDNHSENSCWGGFDLSPGGTNLSVCTHRNGCKAWCTYIDETIACDAEEEGRFELADNIRTTANARAAADRANRKTD
jgi:hypothetical protein